MATVYSAVVVQGEDSPQLQEAARILREHKGISAQLVFEDGATLELPAIATQALQYLMDYLAAGGDVTISPVDREYSSTEAAFFLGASRYYVEQMVEKGEIPSRSVGADFRIAFADLVAHKAKIKARRAEGVRLIQQISEEEGAYDGW